MAEDKNVNKKGFWKGMRAELKKVIWPTGEQTVKSTFATIAFVIAVSLVLIVFNLIFDALSKVWIRSLSHEDVINNVVISGDTLEENNVSGEELPEIIESGEETLEEVSSGEIVEPESITSEE